jgi:hypothetical protein
MQIYSRTHEIFLNANKEGGGRSYGDTPSGVKIFKINYLKLMNNNLCNRAHPGLGCINVL